MPSRVWDDYLTDQDRAHLAIQPARRKGFGERPALLLVDLYRAVFGDRPEPLIEAIRTWPSSCGLAGWNALPHIRRLLLHARQAGIPVVHVTGLDEIPGWRSGRSTTGGPEVSTDALERRRRDHEIVEEVAPVLGEPVLRKSAPSAFWGTPVAGHLNGLRIDTVLVAGESTSGCVRATVVDGRSFRYDMIVVEECVFDRHEAAHAINLFDMDQKYADVIGLEEAIDYLDGAARPVAASAAAR